MASSSATPSGSAGVRFDALSFEPQLQSPARAWTPTWTPATTPGALSEDESPSSSYGFARAHNESASSSPPHILHGRVTGTSSSRSAHVAGSGSGVRGVTNLRGKIAKRIGWDSETSLKSVACYWSQGTSGANDSSLGALIPSIEAYYAINYVTVSCLFLGTCGGYIVASFLNSALQRRFGRGKVLPAGAALQMVGYCILLLPIPFPVMPIAFALIGFGSAVQQAITNSYIAVLPNAAQRLGVLHASYGFGGLLSPLIATAFVSAGIKWSLFFAVSLAVACTALVLHILAFRFEQEQETISPEQTNSQVEMGSTAGGRAQPVTAQTDVVAAAAASHTTGAGHTGDMTILKRPLVWNLACFLFLYVGAEVSIGGWVVSFLLDERNAPQSAGYVASGFWAGITLGRLLLPKINVAIGEKLAVTIYIVAIAGMEVIVWQVRQFLANAIVVAIVGFLLGPLFPTSISLLTKLLPKSQHTFSVGFVAAFGSTGSAVVPFLCGILAQKFGTNVLHPLVISCMGVMFVTWQLMPNVTRRVE